MLVLKGVDFDMRCHGDDGCTCPVNWVLDSGDIDSGMRCQEELQLHKPDGWVLVLRDVDFSMQCQSDGGGTYPLNRVLDLKDVGFVIWHQQIYETPDREKGLLMAALFYVRERAAHFYRKCQLEKSGHSENVTSPGFRPGNDIGTGRLPPYTGEM